MDKLEEIFQMQYELNKRIGIDTAAMSDEEKVKWVLNYSRALGQENAELVDSVPWKWWAKYQKFDPQNARVEVIDMLHFLVSLAQVLGMSVFLPFGAGFGSHRIDKLSRLICRQIRFCQRYPRHKILLLF